VAGASAAVADEGHAKVGAVVDHQGVADEPGALAVELPVRGVAFDGGAVLAAPLVCDGVGPARAVAVNDDDLAADVVAVDGSDSVTDA
jgi:hypothetical protein